MLPTDARICSVILAPAPVCPLEKMGQNGGLQGKTGRQISGSCRLLATALLLSEQVTAPHTTDKVRAESHPTHTLIVKG